MLLEARDVRAGYGVREVLHGIGFRLEPGELVGLLGPNGCGKSTLLRAVTHSLPLTGGSVEIGVDPIGRLSARELARRVAFVPQQESATFDFSVLDIVMMGRYPHLGRNGEQSSDFEIARQAMIAADILPLADRYIGQLSGGEHRRVLLARALAQQAPLLLLDEPTAHLDLAHQVELMERVKNLTRSTGLGALAALHDLNQAAEYCDRLLLLADGQLVAAGIPSEVMTPEGLQAAYGAAVEIGANPLTGKPMVLRVTPAPR